LYAGDLAGTGSLTKNGAGTLKLSCANLGGAPPGALSKAFRQRPEEQSFGLSLKESLRKASDAKRDYARRKMAFVICRPLD